MSSFTKRLRTEYLRDGISATTREFEYHKGKENQGEVIKIPIDFWTDFASIPWPFNMAIPVNGNYNQAAVLHDFLFFLHYIYILMHNGIPIKELETLQPFLKDYKIISIKPRTRKEVDLIFKEAMGVLNVNGFKKAMIYRGVRFGSGFPWRKMDNVKTIEEARKKVFRVDAKYLYENASRN